MLWHQRKARGQKGTNTKKKKRSKGASCCSNPLFSYYRSQTITEAANCANRENTNK